MGILDDAIREHLELKRKHGVPEDELQREEEEALGPARRDVSPQPEHAEAGSEAASGATATAEADHADAPDAAAAASTPFDMDAPSATDEPAHDEPPASMEPPAAVEPPPDADEAAVEAALGDTEPHGFPSLDEDADEDVLTADPDADEELVAEEADDEDADVLEDTPDFLQETPEHDRLWFEQKPPRDFDFD